MPPVDRNNPKRAKSSESEEYVWRYNHRDDRQAMFRTLLQRSAFNS